MALILAAVAAGIAVLPLLDIVLRYPLRGSSACWEGRLASGGPGRVGRVIREGNVRDEGVRLTDVDTRRLQGLVDGFQRVDCRDAASVALLERKVDQAEVLPARRIDADVVTMDSEVVVRDLDAHQTIVFRVVFPGMANAAARRISVLAPLGMAVLGRRAGDHVTWQTPGGLRRLRVARVLYQPEREGRDLA